MAEADQPGHLKIGKSALTPASLAVLVGVPESEVATLLAELEQWDVFSRNHSGVIFSRRMVRDAKISAIRSEAVSKRTSVGGAAARKRGDNREIIETKSRDNAEIDDPKSTCDANALPGLIDQNSIKTVVKPESRYQKEREKQQDTIPDLPREPATDAAFRQADQRAIRQPDLPPPDDRPTIQARPIHSGPAPLAHPQAKICPATGCQMVGGQVLDLCIEAIFDVAKIDHARWRGDLRPLFDWLLEGIDIDHVCTPIARIAAKPGYKVPNSLRYFQSAVDEYCADKPRFVV